MTARQIKENELDKLLSLYAHLHEDDSPIDKNLSVAIWQKILANDSIVYFVVEQDDLLVSSCNLTVIPNLTRGGKSIGLIENVVTHGGYRNKGLGKIVIEAAIAHAKSKNCYKVMLLSSSARIGAHQFYEKLGFSSEDKIGYVKKLA